MNSYATVRPNDFIEIKTKIPSIQEDMRYLTSNNFIGRPIVGYKNRVCILTKQAVMALAQVQEALNQHGLGLRVFDCYRPQIAVDDFFQWSQDPHDQKMKYEYYPNIDKSTLFEKNYIARRSGHTRGSTVDLTIVDLDSNQTLDMGTIFDFMDPLSHPDNQMVTTKQFRNRMYLQTMMKKYGFNSLYTEWWHFTLNNEPYPHTYFNFPVE